MEASRRQPGMLQGLSRFLVQHERCGAGFDVAHPAGLGSGRVSITCRGCGARHEYATATIEVERELTIEPTETPRRPQPRRAAPPIPPRPAPYPESAERSASARPRVSERSAAQAGSPPAASSASGERAAVAAATAAAGRAAARQSRTAAPPREPTAMEALRGFWRSPRATLALLVVAAAALGFGVVRLVNGGGSDNQGTQPAPPPATSVPPPAPAPAPSPPTGEPTPTPAQPSTTTLRTERFTLQVPKGWTERTSTGGLLLQPRGGGRVNVQIFFQRSPGLSLSRMANQTSRFLRHEVPGASLFPNQIRIDGRPAHEITARGPGETAIAVDILHDPYRYLVVRRIFAGAKPDTSQAAGRIVSSFKPR